MNNPDDGFWTERRSGESSCNDFRTAWHRDFGRVVHSAAFRRLQGKTQILGVDNGDFHRTRLTHTLEVSQIGLAIRKKLEKDCKKSSQKKEWQNWLPNPLLIQAICLAHDLGHPPFGHGGEVALNRCMVKNGGFEGNGQTLRIITKLEKYVKGMGMDLTRRAVLGVIKYPARYSDVVNKEKCYPDNLHSLTSKPVFKASEFKPPKCYLDEEDAIVRNWLVKDQLQDEWPKVSKVIKKPGKHKTTKYKSLDASIMDLADDIAYGVHDLEDAIALRLINRQKFYQWFDDCNYRKERLEPILEKKKFEGKLETLVEQLFGKTHCRKRTIGRMVGFFVDAVEIGKVDGFQHPLFRYRAELNNESRNALDVLKEVATDLVIKSTEVQQLEFKGQKIVTELFHAFDTDPDRLLEPVNRKKIQKKSDKKKRVICDYIAGMTDDYAITRYRQLFVPRAGSVFDKL
ncbi:MAG: anti-phage deoxyguanosine triphosphatase [Candidatus Poribacteria bacterium]|nr:anti-phage deoxyguanosine triphosphatase [Candidatus Poribacteria bacterium]